MRSTLPISLQHHLARGQGRLQVALLVLAARFSAVLFQIVRASLRPERRAAQAGMTVIEYFLMAGALVIIILAVMVAFKTGLLGLVQKLISNMSQNIQ